MPKLITVHISSSYSESINVGVGGKDAWKTYKSDVGYELAMETEEERKEWQSPEKIDAVSTWLHEQLKRSIHLRQLDDGTRTGKEGDFAGYEDEPETEPEDGDEN